MTRSLWQLMRPLWLPIGGKQRTFHCWCAVACCKMPVINRLLLLSSQVGRSQIHRVFRSFITARVDQFSSLAGIFSQSVIHDALPAWHTQKKIQTPTVQPGNPWKEFYAETSWVLGASFMSKHYQPAFLLHWIYPGLLTAQIQKELKPWCFQVDRCHGT